MKYVELIGKYLLFIRSMFINRIKPKVLFSRYIEECVDIGVNSLGLIFLTSLFIGIVCCLQTNNTLDSALLPKSMIAVGLKNMIILELSVTLTGIIFAGKNGSHMTNQITSMKMSEQIDAINVMGVNAHAYLALPKIFASMTVFPMLVIFSAATALFSGYLLAICLLAIPSEEFLKGYMTSGSTHIGYMLTKAIVFGFLISSVSVFFGFFTERTNSFDIGGSSKRAFTVNCSLILIFDYLLTHLIL